LMQSDCLYSSLFFEHYNRILLCDWVLGHCSVCLFVWGCACHNAFVLHLGLTSLGISVPLYSSVVPNEQIVSRMRLWTWGSASNAVTKRSVKVSFCSPVSSEISDLLFFVSYFASQSKGTKFDDYFFDDCCVN